jgi:tetratricopeptide (TPR) repeat protein
LTYQGMFESHLGQYESAKVLVEQALALLRPLNERASLARALNTMGRALVDQGNPVNAQDYFQESLDLDSAPSENAFASLYLGHIASRQGDFPLARKKFEYSLELYTQLGDRWGMSKDFSNLGMIDGMLGDYDEAQKAFEASLAIYKEIGDRAGIARCLHNLSNISYIARDYLKTRQQRLECLAICQDIGFQWGVNSTLKHLGDVEKALGQYEQARAYYERSLVLSEQMKSSELRLSALNSLANLSTAQQDLPQARRYYQEALQAAIELDSIPVTVDLLVGIGEVLLAEGKFKESGELLAFACAFTGSDQQTKDKAETLLSSLAEKLPAETITHLREEGKNSTLDEMVKHAQGY